jgi:hypothetical protein
MKSIRRSSLLRFVVLTVLAACLSSGLANAQINGAQSRLSFKTRGGAATLWARDYSSMSNAAGSILKYTPLGPFAPPDPCKPLAWAEWLLSKVGLLL